MTRYPHAPPGYWNYPLLSLFFLLSTTQQILAQFGTDTNYVQYGISGCDSIPEFKVSAGFRFDMQYENAVVVYRAAEFKRNGDRLFLPNWVEDAMYDQWTVEQVGDSSITEIFTLATGDELSFYRELGWYNPQATTPEQIVTNFMSLDTLDFVVELINANTGLRMALLDSMGVLRRDSPGSPTYYGNRPIFSLVEYEIPPSMTGASVFIRTRLYCRGDGDYNPLRVDEIEMAISDKLTHPGLETYLATYSGMPGGVPKLNVSDYRERGSDRLSVAPNPVQGKAIIRFQPGVEKITNLIVYNVTGEVVLVNTNYPEGNEAEKSISFAFPESGKYFVVLYEGETLVAVVPVVVNED